jgi:septum site-determining protein MinC
MPAQSSTADVMSPAAMDIRFSQIGLIQLQLRTTDPDSIIEQLDERMTAAPRFFERMPVGLDISALQHAPSAAELQAVLDAVHRAGLVSIGLISGATGVETLAEELHLPVLGSLQGRPVAAPALAPVVQPVPSPVAPPTVEAPPAVKEAPVLAPAGKDPPLYQLRPVRSGQRVYARNRDLVVLANVGSGAEVIADGSVHVYGTLRGRAIAGAQTDRTARVFCTDFRAELISIAGVFRLFETFPDGLEGRPVHAWLIKEDLRLARIGGLPSLSPARPTQSPAKENAP